MITQARLKELFNYDEISGIFTRVLNHSSNARAGQIAGCLDKVHGYIKIRVDGKQYYAHRLAWVYVHGRLPLSQIDHKDGNRENNSIENLREVSPSGNSQNTRAKGYYYEMSRGYYRAQICVNYKMVRLGNFETEESARDAYLIAKRKLHKTCTI